MINTYKHGDETWIDINSGTEEEIRKVMDEYDISPFVAKEILNKTPKPRAEAHDKYLYSILHFPAFKHAHGEEPNQEIDFIIGQDFLITTRYDHIDSLHKFSKTMEVKSVTDKGHESGSEPIIFLDLLRELYSGLLEELDHIENIVEKITNRIFHGEEREMVVSISEVTRTLINFEKVTNPHHEILLSIKEKGEELFGEKFKSQMEDVILNFLKMNTNIKFNLEILRELRFTNDSLLTTKQNEIVKKLTVLGFVILPLNLIAWIFAMRVEGLPFINHPNGFILVSLLMIACATVALTYVKHKKWL